MTALPRTHVWGTYDTSKPRTRLILQALRDAGLVSRTTHVEVWDGVVDKSQLRGARALASTAWKWLSAYGTLARGLFAADDDDVVFIGYLGQLDVLLAWPLCRWRAQPIVWDAFISLYDTVVHDRKMVGEGHVVAKALWAWEYLACRAADVVVLDTEAHAVWFRRTFHLDDDATAVVFVGAEGGAFAARDDDHAAADDVDDTEPLRVVFYGQFIPLHGIATIVEAARLSDPARVQWVIIGSGQESARIQAMLDEKPVPNLQWIAWVEYEQLRAHIAAADVCLGIFGDSDKAGRVIPNKVFQILSVGAPLVTRDSPGIRELLDDDDEGVTFVPPADPAALLQAVYAQPRRGARVLHRAVVERFSRSTLAAAVADVVTKARHRKQR